jgi:hypothetical protein
MNNYEGIKFVVKARYGDKTKITEAIQQNYPNATIEFVGADADIPTASVEIPDGLPVTTTRQQTAPGQFREVSGEIIASGVNSLLHSLFVDRVS